MCRFVLYLGPPVTLSSLITEPEHSIINQSYQSREREEPLNGDGFGVVWYMPDISPQAALFRSITPAWSNQNLRHLARMTRSSCVLAHVRAATPGLPVTETNTHPFVWQSYAFMHNGVVAGFAGIKRALLDRLGEEAYRMIEGTTDSEHVFALFLEALLRHPQDEPERRMADALSGAVRDVLALCEEAGVLDPCYLNLAVSDGRRAVVCRYTNGREESAASLHLHTGKIYVCRDGVCAMVEPGAGGHAVIVASEPLSADPGWSVVPPNHVVVVGEDRSVDVRPL